MPKAEDPFYNRKPVPDEFIADVGITGLTPQEEYTSRERKYSLADGTDARKFSGKYTGNLWTGSDKDPHYGRKQVDLNLIHGVGETGLTPQQEYANRERKYSLADGTDARKFSTGGRLGSIWSGNTKDPFYGRKSVSKHDIHGVGDTGNTPAADYENRERKQSLFQLNDDPFQQLSGRGNRMSISAVGGEFAKETSERRRSSAVAPHAAQAAAKYHGENLDKIESKPELPPVNAGASSLGASDSTAAEEVNGTARPTTTTTTTTTTATTAGATGGTYHDHATYDDPDSVAPHDMR